MRICMQSPSGCTSDAKWSAWRWALSVTDGWIRKQAVSVFPAVMQTAGLEMLL